MRNLSLRFGERTIFHDIHLETRPGEILGVMGLSGSGKTSLLKCLGGLLRPTGGEIWIGDREIVGMSETVLNLQRQKMGMVFQYAALFDSLTVFENVIFGLRFHEGHSEQELRTRCAGLLNSVGLSGVEELLPAQLSGGMRKRVGLARALAMEPEVVFYDEPTSGLDPVVARVIDDLIQSTRDQTGLTSILVSHDVPSVLRCADRVAFLHDGVILVCDTPAALRETENEVVRQFIEGRADGPIQVAA